MSASEAWREHAKELYTAAVTTNGADDYDGKLVISGPADQVEALVCEGFYIREKNAGAANWTYDDVVWHILPERTRYIVDVDAPLVNNLPADAQPETDANDRPCHPRHKAGGKRQRCRLCGLRDVGGQDDLHQHHTRSSGGGGGNQQRVHHGKQDRRSGQAPCRRILRVEGQPGTEAYQATSNASGGIVRFTRVGNGTYTLLEKAAPEDYVTSDETYELTVSGSRVTMNGKSYSPVTFVNRKAAG